MPGKGVMGAGGGATGTRNHPFRRTVSHPLDAEDEYGVEGLGNLGRLRPPRDPGTG
jgi:hypothetical protein